MISRKLRRYVLAGSLTAALIGVPAAAMAADPTYPPVTPTPTATGGSPAPAVVPTPTPTPTATGGSPAPAVVPTPTPTSSQSGSAQASAAVGTPAVQTPGGGVGVETQGGGLPHTGSSAVPLGLLGGALVLGGGALTLVARRRNGAHE